MLAEIEDAMLQHLAAALTPAAVGYKVASIATYGGELDDDLPQTVRKFPAIWLAFAGSGKPVPVGTQRDRWLVPATWAVMVGARNVRGEAVTRRGVRVGDTLVEVGAYQMLEDVRAALLNQDMGLEIERLAPGPVRTLYNTRLNEQAIAVFAQEWTTRYVIRQAAEPIDPSNPDWLRLGVEYRLKPGDDVTDASDLITLPSAA